MLAFANIGAAALWLLFLWLLSAAGAAWMAERKGYTERVGLLFGLVLSIVGFIIVCLLPGRPGSTWKLEGPFPNPGTHRPLGFSALGPMTDPIEQPDSLGPSLAEAVQEPPADEPPAGESPAGEPAAASEPPAAGEPAAASEPPAAAEPPASEPSAAEPPASDPPSGGAPPAA